MQNTCQAHGTTPTEEFQGHPCYGELWECEKCGLTVCAGYGAADNNPDLCDNCTINHPADKQPTLNAV